MHLLCSEEPRVEHCSRVIGIDCIRFPIIQRCDQDIFFLFDLYSKYM